MKELSSLLLAKTDELSNSKVFSQEHARARALACVLFVCALCALCVFFVCVLCVYVLRVCVLCVCALSVCFVCVLCARVCGWRGGGGNSLWVGCVRRGRGGRRGEERRGAANSIVVHT